MDAHELKLQLVNTILDINSDFNLGDFGNDIGIEIAKHFDNENSLEDFIYGLRHGVSLTDGTHDLPVKPIMPLYKVINETKQVGICGICNSSIIRSFPLFGKKHCINKKCINHFK